MGSACRQAKHELRADAAHAEEAREPSHPDATLGVKLTGTDDRPELVILLSNSGVVPITVDRELVIPLWIHLKNAAGEEVSCEWLEAREARSGDGAYWAQRLVNLAPGESVARRVLLRDGFYAWSAWTPFYYPEDGVVLEGRPHTSERRRRLSDSVRIGDIRRVTVSCWPRDRRTVAEHLGVPSGELTVFTGMLSATWDKK